MITMLSPEKIILSKVSDSRVVDLRNGNSGSGGDSETVLLFLYPPITSLVLGLTAIHGLAPELLTNDSLAPKLLAIYILAPELSEIDNLALKPLGIGSLAPEPLVVYNCGP
ncbi:hypothetical protein L1987_87712 [Smallanthus sonchifolius]|nr:hypothetical protein L1987_87712 [Smallanthus sonchifolius]